MARPKSSQTKKAPALSDLHTVDELQAALVSTHSELVETKRSHAARELANTARLKELRVRVARLQTRLNSPVNQEEKA
jgi:ribosomal protein L29